MAEAPVVRVAAGLLLVVLAVGYVVYDWWRDPERQIRRMIGEVVGALTHEDAEGGLESLSAASGLEDHLTPDVTLELGEGPERVTGRQQIVTMAAHARASLRSLRIELDEVHVAVESGSAATVTATATIVMQSRAGREATARQALRLACVRPEGRWLIATVRTSTLPEPLS